MARQGSGLSVQAALRIKAGFTAEVPLSKVPNPRTLMCAFTHMELGLAPAQVVKNKQQSD